MIAGVFFATVPSMSAANAQEDVVKGVIKAVKQGEDLNAAYPGAVSANDIASLQRVAKCRAQNLMRQAKGRYTVVWFCGSKAALGMEILVTGKQVVSVTTMEVFRRPAFQPR